MSSLLSFLLVFSLPLIAIYSINFILLSFLFFFSVFCIYYSLNTAPFIVVATKWRIKVYNTMTRSDRVEMKIFHTMKRVWQLLCWKVFHFSLFNFFIVSISIKIIKKLFCFIFHTAFDNLNYLVHFDLINWTNLRLDFFISKKRKLENGKNPTRKIFLT